MYFCKRRGSFIQITQNTQIRTIMILMVQISMVEAAMI